MMLAMLVAHDSNAQLQLAETRGVVKLLVLKMRDSTDDDVRVLCRDLFAMLVANDAAKALVESDLRGDMADAPENFV
jgi:hypothetical protein